MTSYVTPKKNTAYKFYVGLIDQSNTKLLKANPTIAAGDFKVSTDGGAFANLTTLPSVSPAAGRAVVVDLSAAEMNGDNIVFQAVDAAGAEWCDLLINIQTTARQIDDLAYPVTSGRSMVVDAAGLVDANVVKVGPTGAGTAQTAGDIMADTNDIQTRLPAALVGGRMDSSVGAMAASVLTAAAINAAALNGKGDWLAPTVAGRTLSVDATGAAFANVVQWFSAPVLATNVAGVPQVDVNYSIGLALNGFLQGSLIGGFADSGTTTTVVDAARTETTVDFWKGCWIRFGGGTIQNEVRQITAFDPVTDTITFAPPLTGGPVSTELYWLLPGARMDVGSWLGSAVNSLIAGRVDSSSGAIDSSTTAASNLKSGATGLVPGTCAAGSTTTSIVTNLTEATDSHYNGRAITFTGGALLGQTSDITAYNGTTKTLTVTALTEAPANTDPFVIS